MNEIRDQEDVPEDVTLGENQIVYEYKMTGCNYHAKEKSFGTANWYKHLVCDCTSQEMNDRKILALSEKTHQIEVIQWKENYRQNVRRRLDPMQEEYDVPNIQRHEPNDINPNVAN